MKVVLILSGGLDSATLLYSLLSDGYEVRCLSFNYGQRHSKELDFAADICRELKVEHRIVDLSSIKPLLAGSSQTDESVEVPEGHYAEESMKLTVVPNRNMIMLAIAASWAISTKSDAVAFAAHAGDHAIYPDCRAGFVSAMDLAIRLADWNEVRVIAPFIGFHKEDIVRLAACLDVPFDRTWSCYKGGEIHCGRCGTCTERRESFELAGVTDPTRYEQ